jgi:lysophospholipase L1-like esterase
MPGPFNFDAYLGWVNITDPNNIPEDARVIGADDMLRFENLGLDAKAKFDEVDATLAGLDSDSVMSTLIADTGSETRYAVKGMVDSGIAPFKAVTDAMPAKVSDQVALAVPPLVTSAIAADGTVAASAAAAVNSAMAGKELTESFSATNADSVGGILDQDFRRTWIDIAADGGPTDHAVSKMSTKLDGRYIGSNDSYGGDSVGGLVDQDQRRTWIDISASGGPTSHALSKMQPALGLPATIATQNIVCWGDSITGSTPGVTAWSVLLSTLTGRTVTNRGSGGETSVTIAARSGALPALFISNTGEIPATATSVNLTIQPYYGQTPAPLVQAYGGYEIGTLAGVPGRLARNATTGQYSFTRDNAGTAVPLSRPKPYYSTPFAVHRGDINIIFLGANGPDHPRPLTDSKAMAEYVNTAEKRFLVVSRTNGNDAEDEAYFAEFGRRFFSIRKYLVEYGLADAGITATSTDIADMAAGKVPTSLRVDGIHWTQAASDIMAKITAERLKEMGWV